MAPIRVVVIGGGFGGINVVKALRHRRFHVTLIDKKNHHLFQPLLYQVATAALSPAEIAVPLREMFRHQKNMAVIMSTVQKVDTKRCHVISSDGTIFPYDYLILAVGASHCYFGHDEWAPLAPGLKTITDALTIRENLLLSFERAENILQADARQKLLRFVVIGGGPTGVEMAGALAEISRKTLSKNFTRVQPEKSCVYLIEGDRRILPAFHEKLARRAHRDLEKMGVIIKTGHYVSHINEEGIQVSDEFIETTNVVWAAGNQAPPLLQTLGVPLDLQGRAIVNRDLTVPDHPEVFVIGDAAYTKGKGGSELPAVAPVAIQQARYVGKIIRRRIDPPRRAPFRYFDKGGLATIGRYKAIGYFRKLRFSGIFAWVVWGVIHILYLAGYRSKVRVLLDWMFHYATGSRGARVIHQSLDQTESSPSNPFDSNRPARS